MTEPHPVQRSFTLTRVLDAPRELVFAAWTDPGQLDWFFSGHPGPVEPIEVDLRVGGAWRQWMIVNDDLQYWTGGIYREISPCERLSFVFGAVDGWPKLDPDRLDDGLLVTITLAEFGELGDRTELVLRADIPEHLSVAEVEDWFASGMPAGWGMTVDRLVARFADSVTAS